MEVVEVGTLVIQSVNAVLWSVLVWRILRQDRSVTGGARRAICLVLFLGMWVLELGTLTPFGLPLAVAKPVNAGFTMLSAIIALTLLTTDEPGGRQDE